MLMLEIKEKNSERLLCFNKEPVFILDIPFLCIGMKKNQLAPRLSSFHLITYQNLTTDMFLLEVFVRQVVCKQSLKILNTWKLLS